MNILIDTHIFLWLAYEPEKIDPKYYQYLENLDNTLYLSSISIVEMMIKKSLGNLQIDFDIIQLSKEMGIQILDFDAKSALLLGTMPFHHKDPFDRMIIAQSISNNYYIFSVDRKFSQYNCKLL